MRSRPDFKLAAIAVLVPALLVACGEGVQPDQEEVVHFSALETDVPTPQVFEDPGSSLTPAQLKSYEPIVEGFEKNARKLLRRDDIHTQLERIDRVFVLSGHYLELVAIYQKDVDAHGVDSPVADRLAWGYIRLGQRKKARDLIDRLIAKAPDDAMTWFVEGAYWLQDAPKDRRLLRNVVSAWKKTLSIDPDFRGFEGVMASMLREQIRRFEKQIPPTASPPVSQAEKAVQAALTAASRPREKPANTPGQTGGNAAVPATNTATTGQTNGQTTGQATGQAQATAKKNEPSADEQYGVLIARGVMALNNGQPKQAEEFFVKARKFKPHGIDAAIGQLRAAWTNTAMRGRVSKDMRKLATRKDVTARQAWDIAMFAHTKMGDDDLARKMITRVQKLDPAFAKRTGASALLKQLK